MTKLTHALAATGVAAMFLLAGCGPESTTATTSTSSSSSTGSSSDESSANANQGPGGDQQEEIQACLKEAGLEDKLPQRPSGESGERPSAPPSGEPPTTGDHKAGGPFQDEEVQAALKACGIESPERPNGANPPS
jgi:hypothetical protein